MGRRTNGKGNLNSAFVEKVKEPGRHGDGNNLYLNVASAPSGEDGKPRVTKSWIFRFMRHGRAREMGLGRYPFIGLADARQLAIEAGKLLAKGQDPIEVRDAGRDAQRLMEAKKITFHECAEQFLAANEKAWTNAKHCKQWTQTLHDYVDPVLGSLPVPEVDTGLVMKVLSPLWTTKTVTAERVRGRLEKVLDFAKVSGWRTGENPARWRGHLEHLLPKRDCSKGFGEAKVGKLERHAAVPWGGLPAFMAQLRQREELAAEALEFTILTMARSGEVLGARREEFDLENALWIVPADRTKTRTESRKALSRRAVEIARRRIAAGGEFLFPGVKGKPLQSRAMLDLLKRMGRSETVHGFRASARTWLAESTNYPREICEMALGHAVGGDTERAYQRGDMFKKRVRVAQAWADYCSSPPEVAAAEATTGTITPLRRSS